MPGLNIALQSISSRINRLPNDLKSEIASYINFCDICGKSGASELHGTLYWSCARERRPPFRPQRKRMKIVLRASPIHAPSATYLCKFTFIVRRPAQIATNL